jgi:DNA repair photolyase
LTAGEQKANIEAVLFADSPRKPLIGIARLAAESELLEAKSRVQYFELPTRRFLNHTTERMPFQWTINPYRGCEFGCKYCYARYTHEFLELGTLRDFEEKIYAKQFVASGFRAELSKTPLKDAIAIGTATDPYQPSERRFGITRAILEVFAASKGRRLSVTTKSDLIVRDLELLRTIARANVLHVNLTITTVDEKLARMLEPRAPRPALRLGAVKALADAGIVVGVFPNPVLPSITDSEASLDALAASVKQAGGSYLGGGVLFLKPVPRDVFFPFLREHFPDLLPRYQALFRSGAFLRGDYPKVVKERIAAIRVRHGLADSPLEYSPELWEGDPQGSLF